MTDPCTVNIGGDGTIFFASIGIITTFLLAITGLCAVIEACKLSEKFPLKMLTKKGTE